MARQQKSLTACIITRNEAAVLSRCLRSLRGICDEVCVVDTGSEDGTLGLAKQLGASCAEYTLCNDQYGRMSDFSLARNACLELATSSWILVIDADEVLSLESGPSVLQHVKASKSDAVSIKLHSHRTEWLVPRLFRNLESHRYRDRVHEWLSTGTRIVEDPTITISNKPNKRGKESSTSRDLRLCPIMLAEDPNNERAAFYLARALLRRGRYAEAIIMFRRYMALDSSFAAGIHYALHQISICHFLSGQHKYARQIVKRALEIDNDRAESHCLLGDIYVALQDFPKAILAYQLALNCPPPPLDYPLFVNQSFYGRYPKRRLRQFDYAPLDPGSNGA